MSDSVMRAMQMNVSLICPGAFVQSINDVGVCGKQMAFSFFFRQRWRMQGDGG